MPRLKQLLSPLLLGPLLMGAHPLVAIAGGNNSKTPTLSELRDRERDIETRRERAMRSVQDRLQAQTLDPDEALMERSRIKRDYQNEMLSLRYQQDATLRALDEKRKPSGSRSNNSALPRIPSQSVVTYPQDGGPATEETPQAEGRQKNVGFGTRELEF